MRHSYLRQCRLDTINSKRIIVLFKTMALITIILYVTFLLCQNVSGYQNSKELDIFDFKVIPKKLMETKNNLTPVTKESKEMIGTTIRSTVDAVGTVTPKPPIVELNDLFISVKTTKANHNNRLDIILKTWFQMAVEQTWFFTDADDVDYQNKANEHLINTNCPMGHSRHALCCKMAAELNTFLETSKKWFCHFDDDNYVNVPQLVRLLNEYNPTMEWYLGKPSVASPLELHLEYKKYKTKEAKVKFWFATGGAGFCISRALALRMLPIVGGNKLIAIGDRIRFPDDVTIGFVIEHLLNVPLTVIDEFHSHLEQMDQLQAETFHKQVSFSYAHSKNQWNVINIDGFDKITDPTRFKSLHCHLFPYLRTCSQK